MNKLTMIFLTLLVLSGCATRPCAYIAIGERVCLAPLPVQAPFAQRNEMIVASSAQGPLMALAQTQWDSQRYASAVTTAFGQRLYVLSYDGKIIQFEQSDLPLPIRAENVMLDTQLMWWPLALLQMHLPSSARLIEFDDGAHRVRELWWQDQKRIRIVYQQEDGAAVVNYEQLGLHYQLLIKEVPDA